MFGQDLNLGKSKGVSRLTTTAGIVVLVGFTVFVAAKVFTKKYPKPAQDLITKVAAEVSSQGDFLLSPVVNSTGTEFAFTRNMHGGRKLGLLDLTTGKLKELPHKGAVDRPFGYSFNDRFLLYAGMNKQKLQLFDRETSKDRHIPVEQRVKYAAWLSSNSFCFVEDGKRKLYHVLFKPHKLITNSIEISDVNGLTAMSEAKVAVSTESNLLAIDFEKGVHEDMSAPDMPSSPSYLQYSPENRQFLFCSWNGANWRHLYRLSQTNNGWQYKQETFENEHTYNGRWLEKGNGFAYVGNISNHLYLAVRPSNPVAATNLFCGGRFYGYCVSADGERIYAVASPNAEPMGIWEYNIAQGSLRRAEADPPHFSMAECIPRKEDWAISRDGTRIAYYTVPPKVLGTRKHPVILYLPVPENQANGGWDMFSQFFGNIEVYHIAVNYRGVDGYGKQFSDVSDPTLSSDDVKAVYDEIIKNPYVDKNEIYLMGFCAATQLANQVITRFPNRWAGLINIRGFIPEQDPVIQQKLRIFYFYPSKNEEDVSKEDLAKFETWAPKVSAQIMRSDEMGNADENEVARTTLLALADFIFGK